MNSFRFWEKYGTLLAVNGAGLSLVVMLMLRGAWSFAAATVLILIFANMLVVKRIRRRSETPGHADAGRGRFFRFYGYALTVGGICWLVQRIREGAHWIDLVVFLILALLVVAMLSIGNRMRRSWRPHPFKP